MPARPLRRLLGTLTAVALLGLVPAGAASASTGDAAQSADRAARLHYGTVVKRGGVAWQMCVRKVDWETRIQYRLQPAKPKVRGTIRMHIVSGSQTADASGTFGRGFGRVKPSYSSSWDYLDTTQVTVVLKVKGAGKKKQKLVASSLRAC